MGCEVSFWRLSGADSHMPSERQHPWYPVLPVTFSKRPAWSRLRRPGQEAPSSLPPPARGPQSCWLSVLSPCRASRIGWPEGHTPALGSGTAPGEPQGQKIELSWPGGSSQNGPARAMTNS